MVLKLVMSGLFALFTVLVTINMFKIFSLNRKDGSSAQLQEYSLKVKKLFRQNLIFVIFFVLLTFALYLKTFG